MNEAKWIEQFTEIENNFNKAVVSNNIDEIKRCIADDWVLVDARGGIIARERFLQVVEDKLLTHTSMTKEVLRVKVYDNMALVTGRGKNTAMWQGQAIAADEWVTDVYRKVNGHWLCVLTHLTPVETMS